MKQHKETEYYYWVETPIYKKYKTVEVDDYCDCCNSVIGSHKEKRPVGEPIRSKWTRHKKDSFYLMSKILEKQMMPIITKKILGSSKLLDRLKP